MTRANLDTIAAIYEAFEARELEVMTKLFDPDVIVTQTPELPWGGRYHGHDGVATFFSTLVSHIDSTVAVGNLFAAGDAVVQVGHTRGTTVPAGVAFDVPEVHVWHRRDGRVISYQAFIDTPAMLHALRASA